VRAKAIERGLVEIQKANQLGLDELLDFIYLPGFSTCRIPDDHKDVYGRGVDG